MRCRSSRKVCRSAAVTVIALVVLISPCLGGVTEVEPGSGHKCISLSGSNADTPIKIASDGVSGTVSVLYSRGSVESVHPDRPALHAVLPVSSVRDVTVAGGVIYTAVGSRLEAWALTSQTHKSIPSLVSSLQFQSDVRGVARDAAGGGAVYVVSGTDVVCVNTTRVSNAHTHQSEGEGVREGGERDGGRVSRLTVSHVVASLGGVDAADVVLRSLRFRNGEIEVTVRSSVEHADRVYRFPVATELRGSGSGGVGEGEGVERELECSINSEGGVARIVNAGTMLAVWPRGVNKATYTDEEGLCKRGADFVRPTTRAPPAKSNTISHNPNPNPNNNNNNNNVVRDGGSDAAHAAHAAHATHTPGSRRVLSTTNSSSSTPPPKPPYKPMESGRPPRPDGSMLFVSLFSLGIAIVIISIIGIFELRRRSLPPQTLPPPNLYGAPKNEAESFVPADSSEYGNESNTHNNSANNTRKSGRGGGVGRGKGKMPARRGQSSSSATTASSMTTSESRSWTYSTSISRESSMSMSQSASTAFTNDYAIDSSGAPGTTGSGSDSLSDTASPTSPSRRNGR